ncbi:MAG: hypothetical protein OXU36_20820 [Candidatus Poribacteria bacterium]|nr:hypothetical protein [Candidatus Poribacteria bacterium]
MTQQQNKPKTLEETLTDALQLTVKLDLDESVKLAVQTLLLMRGPLDPKLFKRKEMFNPYPVLVKYIRASNAETLGGLVNDVQLAISPNFITLRCLGEVTETIYRSETKFVNEALRLLKEETTPLVMLMKKIYQDARGGIDEADEAQLLLEGASEGEV